MGIIGVVGGADEDRTKSRIPIRGTFTVLIAALVPRFGHMSKEISIQRGEPLVVVATFRIGSR